jgi:hypothetical protein
MTFGKLQVDQIESSTRVLNVDDLLSGTEDLVTSVGLSAPTGFTVLESPVTGSGVISLTYSQGYSLPSNTSQSNWDTAYLERRYWDGGSSGLNASTARTSLGLGNSSTLNIGTIAGTVAAGDDARFTTNLSYTPSTRLLSSSTGSDVTIPEATTTVPGFQSAADKVKLDSIATGAQVNVPTNLTYTQSTRLLGSSTGDDVTLPDATTSFSGLMSATDKGKLDGIASGAEVNVNADWDSVSGDSLILNKPAIPAAATATPQPLGTAAAGNGTNYARDNHVHAMPNAANVGADPSGTAASAVSAHIGDVDPHPNKYASAAQGVTNGNSHDHSGGDGAQISYNSLSDLPTLGGAAALNVGTTIGTVASGDDARFHDDVTLNASVADILGLSGQELTADNPGADRLIFWDHSAGKLTHLALGANLSITGTTLSAASTLSEQGLPKWNAGTGTMLAPGNCTSSLASATATVGTVVYHQIGVPVSVINPALICRASGLHTGSTDVSLGIFSSINNRPAILLASVALSFSAINLTQGATATVTLQPDFYWLAFLATAATGVPSFVGSVTNAPGVGAGLFAEFTNATGPISTLLETSEILPATATPTLGGGNSRPVVFLGV